MPDSVKLEIFNMLEIDDHLQSNSNQMKYNGEIIKSRCLTITDLNIISMTDSDRQNEIFERNCVHISFFFLCTFFILTSILYERLYISSDISALLLCP